MHKKIDMKIRVPKEKERYRQAKEWIQKNFREQQYESTIEGLGTYATTMLFHQYSPEHLVRKKDGTPDWEKEHMLIRYLWKQTFKHQIREYTPTEGDQIRSLQAVKDFHL